MGNANEMDKICNFLSGLDCFRRKSIEPDWGCWIHMKIFSQSKVKRNIETSKKHPLESMNLLDQIKKLFSNQVKTISLCLAFVAINLPWVISILIVLKNMSGRKITPVWWKGSFINHSSPAGSVNS